MASRKLVKRSRPSVATENEAAARANISIKFEIILGELRLLAQPLQSTIGGPDAGAGTRLRHLPGSQNKFNSWSHDKLAPEVAEAWVPFRSNSNNTLVRHPQFASIQNAIKKVYEYQSRKVAPSKAEKLSGYLAKLKDERALRKILEMELLSMKIKVLESDARASRAEKNYNDLKNRVKTTRLVR